MELYKQLSSVDLSNKLHVLGVTHPSVFYRDSTRSAENDIQQWEVPDYCPDNVNCYTVAELGELLGANIPKIFQNNNRKWVMFNPFEGGYSTYETEADARAKMLIYFIENKLITL